MKEDVAHCSILNLDSRINLQFKKLANPLEYFPQWSTNASAETKCACIRAANRIHLTQIYLSALTDFNKSKGLAEGMHFLTILPFDVTWVHPFSFIFGDPAVHCWKSLM